MHPCCNGSLQTGTKIIAIVQMVFAILIVIFGVLSLSFGGLLTFFGLSEEKLNSTHSGHFDGSSGDDKFDSLSDNEKVAVLGMAFMIMSILIIIGGALSLLLSVLLLLGSNKRNRALCMIWFVVELIGAVLMTIQFIRAIFAGTSFASIFTDFVAISLSGYFLWVVWAFMEEIKEDRAVPSYTTVKPRA